LARNPITSKDESKIQNRRSRWLLIFTLLLASLLLYITLHGLDWNAFWVSIRYGHYEFLLLTIPITSINYFIRALRWSCLINSEKKIPLISIFWANMVGYMGNDYLPARAGELIRSAYLGRQNGLGTSFVLATALVERLLDVIALVLIGSISLLVQSNISPLLANALRFMAFAGTAGLIVIIAAPFQEKLIRSIVTSIPLPEKYSLMISQQISRFLTGIRSLHNGRRLGLFILLTAAIWLIDAFANTLGVRIISQTLTIRQALIFLAALGLSSAIPSTPGYIGVYQFVAVSVLAPFGFSRANALAYILISQILHYLLVSFLGLIGLWRINRLRPSPETVELIKE
jgi:uncharacterized protein (TIRG00374 family)